MVSGSRRRSAARSGSCGGGVRSRISASVRPLPTFSKCLIQLISIMTSWVRIGVLLSAPLRLSASRMIFMFACCCSGNRLTHELEKTTDLCLIKEGNWQERDTEEKEIRRPWGEEAEACRGTSDAASARHIKVSLWQSHTPRACAPIRQCRSLQLLWHRWKWTAVVCVRRRCAGCRRGQESDRPVIKRARVLSRHRLNTLSCWADSSRTARRNVPLD